MRKFRYSTVTIADTPTLMVGENPHRRYLKISNADQSWNVWFAFGQQPTANGGFVVADFSPSEEFRYEDLGSLLTTAVYGITSSGHTMIAAICEGYEEIGPDERPLGATQAPFGMS